MLELVVCILGYHRLMYIPVFEDGVQFIIIKSPLYIHLRSPVFVININLLVTHLIFIILSLNLLDFSLKSNMRL